MPPVYLLQPVTHSHSLLAAAEEANAEGDDDEANWQRKQRLRLAKDIAKLQPRTLAGGSGLAGPGPQPTGDQPQLHPKPERGFETVGGLSEVIKALKEVVVLPLLYPQLSQQLGINFPGYVDSMSCITKYAGFGVR